jgi:hypothetical protein
MASKVHYLHHLCLPTRSSSPPSSSGRRKVRPLGIWSTVTADAADGGLALLDRIEAAVGAGVVAVMRTPCRCVRTGACGEHQGQRGKRGTSEHSLHVTDSLSRARFPGATERFRGSTFRHHQRHHRRRSSRRDGFGSHHRRTTACPARVSVHCSSQPLPGLARRQGKTRSQKTGAAPMSDARGAGGVSAPVTAKGSTQASRVRRRCPCRAREF